MMQGQPVMDRAASLQVEPEVFQESKLRTTGTSSPGEGYMKWHEFPAKGLPCHPNTGPKSTQIFQTRVGSSSRGNK